MTPEPVTIGPLAFLSEAARLMSTKGLKRLPVVDQGHRLLGVLGRLDILTALAAGFLPQAAPRHPVGVHSAPPRMVADGMNPVVPTASPESPLPDALALRPSARATRAVVVEAE